MMKTRYLFLCMILYSFALHGMEDEIDEPGAAQPVCSYEIALKELPTNKPERQPGLDPEEDAPLPWYNICFSYCMLGRSIP